MLQHDRRGAVDQAAAGGVSQPVTVPAVASPSTTADYKVGQEISYTFLIKNTGDVTLTGENYLTIASQTITVGSVNLSGTHVTGTLAAARFPAD